jgi:hypothetical protein
MVDKGSILQSADRPISQSRLKTKSKNNQKQSTNLPICQLRKRKENNLPIDQSTD